MMLLSILGPTLFTIYVNDLLSLPLHNANIICYADDTVVLFNGATWETALQTTERGMSLIADWLDSNLLTLNSSKTKYIPFHKTSVTCPKHIPSLTIHQCTPTTKATAESTTPKPCKCEVIDRVRSIKYLGIQVDENLSFNNHITLVATRLRKLIYIMKSLRRSAPRDVLQMVYISLCQSILIYCLSVWGGAIKTSFIEIERAQRAVLKVMLTKPFRFPTDMLYKEANVLRVRQLYVWRVCCAQHKKVLVSPNYETILKNRVYQIPLPRVRTMFAKRLPTFSHPFIYNRVNKKCKVKNLSPHKAKLKIKNWLMDLSYEETEEILPSTAYNMR